MQGLDTCLCRTPIVLSSCPHQYANLVCMFAVQSGSLWVKAMSEGIKSQMALALPPPLVLLFTQR